MATSIRDHTPFREHHGRVATGTRRRHPSSKGRDDSVTPLGDDNNNTAQGGDYSNKVSIEEINISRFNVYKKVPLCGVKNRSKPPDIYSWGDGSRKTG